MDIFDTNKPKKDDFNEELNDIILDKKDKKFDIKKIALLSGSALLLLIIVISIVKITSTEKKEKDEFFAQEESKSVKESFEESFEQVPIIEEEPQEIEEVQEKKVPQAEKIVEKEKVVEEEKKEKKEKKEKIKKVEKKETFTKKIAAKGNYYIQVGAFYRYPPSKKFLNKIKKNGYNYIIKTVVKENSEIKKVLIGPFLTRNDAKNALTKVKRYIKKDAFIVKVK